MGKLGVTLKSSGSSPECVLIGFRDGGAIAVIPSDDMLCAVHRMRPDAHILDLA